MHPSTEPNTSASKASIQLSGKPTGQKPNSDSSAAEGTPSLALTTGLLKQPAVPSVLDKQQTELYLPFTGVWIVTVGGEIREGTPPQNLLHQPYSFGFSGAYASGLRYKNDGKANEDYFEYTREIIAPAGGTVVEVIDDIRENSPGLRNPYALIGNAFVLQHSNREYSVLAFLKQGSIRVKVGDRIARGQVLAQCGNSGNAAEPLLHYHLQDSPYLQTAKGIKFYFERMMVNTNGKKQLQVLHIPVLGEVISPE